MPVIYPGASLFAVQCLIRLFRTNFSALRQVLLDPRYRPRAVPGSLPPCCRRRIFTGLLTEIVAAYAQNPTAGRYATVTGVTMSGKAAVPAGPLLSAMMLTRTRPFGQSAERSIFGLSNGIGVSAKGKQLFDAVGLSVPPQSQVKERANRQSARLSHRRPGARVCWVSPHAPVEERVAAGACDQPVGTPYIRFQRGLLAASDLR
jgi:hypothetical protein